MKRISTYFMFLITLVFTSCFSTQQIDSQSYSPDSQDITYQQFYDDLSPYGNWVNYQDYGYVWVPDEAGFRPYYNNGHWIYTNYGWTWVSDYNWGWAPFHYGRWLYDDDYGWMWIPGYEWAPAWVSWRNSPDYYGWAPLGPGININISIGSQIPYNYWAFVPHRYINSPRINNYYVDRQKNITIINNTTIINNVRTTDRKTVYVAGPPATDVEQTTRQKIRQVKLVNRTSPGNTQVTGNSVSIYRPPVKETPQTNNIVKPRKIFELNDVKARHSSLENRNAENVQKQPAPVTEQKLPPIVEKPRPQPPVNDQNNLPENKTRGNEKLNPPQQNPVEQTTPKRDIPQKEAEQKKIFDQNNIQKNNPPDTKEKQNVIQQPVIKNNPPEQVQENKPPVRVLRKNQPVEKKFDNSAPPVKTQREKVQQNKSQPKRIIQQPVRETPVIKNQDRIQQPRVEGQDLKRNKKDN
ncbi:MAG: DUF6600 domain-containing protein [Ginsengibacter sp.]